MKRDVVKKKEKEIRTAHVIEHTASSERGVIRLGLLFFLHFAVLHVRSNRTPKNCRDGGGKAN